MCAFLHVQIQIFIDICISISVSVSVKMVIGKTLGLSLACCGRGIDSSECLVVEIGVVG